MRRPTPIAIQRPLASKMRGGLERLARRVAVFEFVDLYDDFEALCDFRPQILVLAGELTAEADLGGLRLARRVIPGLAIVLAVPRELEVATAQLAVRARARVLLTPFTQGELASALTQTPSDGPEPSPEQFLDLTRGISDEINNPLMFAAGHAQLLAATLDPERDADRVAQVEAIRNGLDRISATMAKVRLLQRASSRAESPRAVSLADALAGATPPEPVAVEPPAAEPLVVAADPELLAVAIRALGEVGAELATVSERVALLAARGEDGPCIRLVLTRPQLGDWQLPRAFEPYYLNRVLRGTPHGLSLFLVQTIARAHGGLAIARRLPDGAVALEVTLPESG